MGKNKFFKFLIILIVLEITGCAVKTAPEEWLSKPEKAAVRTFGAWINVTYKIEGTTKLSKGELIAIEKDKLYLFGEEGLIAISVDKILRARVELYKTQEGLFAPWTIAGTLSTLFHGYGMVLTAPLWVISGITCTVGESKSGILEYPKVPLEEIRKFARFPQGIPEGLDLNQLKPRPLK